MSAVTYINPETMAHSPAYSQAVLIPSGHALLVVGGQNGVDASGSMVGDDMGSQAAQALRNVEACVTAAGGDFGHVVKLTILLAAGAPLAEGYGAFVAAWGGRPNPPAVTAAVVQLAVPGALCEIEALAAIPPA